MTITTWLSDPRIGRERGGVPNCGLSRTAAGLVIHYQVKVPIEIHKDPCPSTAPVRV